MTLLTFFGCFIVLTKCNLILIQSVSRFFGTTELTDLPPPQPGNRDKLRHACMYTVMRATGLIVKQPPFGAISVTVCGWHVWILLRIPVAQILWDFDFLRGLAPGRLDGFSIGKYEKNRESFNLSAAKFERGAMRYFFFWGGGGIAPALEPFQNKVSSLVLRL